MMDFLTTTTHKVTALDFISDVEHYKKAFQGWPFYPYGTDDLKRNCYSDAEFNMSWEWPSFTRQKMGLRIDRIDGANEIKGIGFFQLVIVPYRIAIITRLGFRPEYRTSLDFEGVMVPIITAAFSVFKVGVVQASCHGIDSTHAVARTFFNSEVQSAKVWEKRQGAQTVTGELCSFTVTESNWGSYIAATAVIAPTIHISDLPTDKPADLYKTPGLYDDLDPSQRPTEEPEGDS